MIHGGFFLHLNQIVQQAGQVVEKFQIILAERNVHQIPTRELTSSHWTALPPGCFKANWDAGFDRKKGRVGLGLVIRDQHGIM